MNRTRFSRLHGVLGLLALLAAPLAPAGQLVPAPLQEVLSRADRVFVGRVVKREHSRSESRVDLRLTVTPLRMLRGPAMKEDVELSYSEVIPLIRNEQGEVIGSFSPIISGSGEEFNAQPGEEWLFLVNGGNNGGPVFLLRVEPPVQADILFPPEKKKRKR